MKIAAFNVELQSSRQFTQSFEVRERLELWRDSAPTPGRADVSISDAARRAQGADGAAVRAPFLALQGAVIEAVPTQLDPAQADQAQTAAGVELDDAVDNDPRLSMLIRMIEFLTGEPVRRFCMSDLEGASSADTAADAAPSAHAATTPTRQQAPRAGFGLEYDFSATYAESETTRFSAAGVVRTADGAEIRFELGFAMSRSYSESVSLSVRAGDPRLKDPLVLDFGGPAAALSDVRFEFDLDADGTLDKIPLLGGSGLLAFDRNENGRIDDGRELFGPVTGNGFDELAALDEDGNGWIDEADGAWSQLRVWRPDAEGKGSVQSLKEAGVGAFYLGSVDTAFSLNNTANETQALMRANSIYLRADGSAGTVSQVDLAV